MFVFKKQVEEVVLHATVVDEQGHLITGLDKSAFSITQNGTPRADYIFPQGGRPGRDRHCGVDNSGSMRDKRQQVNDAVLNLIRASNSQDQVFVVKLRAESVSGSGFHV